MEGECTSHRARGEATNTNHGQNKKQKLAFMQRKSKAQIKWTFVILDEPAKTTNPLCHTQTHKHPMLCFITLTIRSARAYTSATASRTSAPALRYAASLRWKREGTQDDGKIASIESQKNSTSIVLLENIEKHRSNSPRLLFICLFCMVKMNDYCYPSERPCTCIHAFIPLSLPCT